ncbi:hypothetical protein LPJ61_006822, partial [Coemansia biformis]
QAPHGDGAQARHDGQLHPLARARNRQRGRVRHAGGAHFVGSRHQRCARRMVAAPL